MRRTSIRPYASRSHVGARQQIESGDNRRKGKTAGKICFQPVQCWLQCSVDYRGWVPIAEDFSGQQVPRISLKKVSAISALPLQLPRESMLRGKEECSITLQPPRRAATLEGAPPALPVGSSCKTGPLCPVLYKLVQYHQANRSGALTKGLASCGL